MNPVNAVLGLGSKVKLSDMIKDEMSAYSVDRETRRTAVQRILTERGLGSLVQPLGSFKCPAEVSSFNYRLTL
jgi:hypothetical protein